MSRIGLKLAQTYLMYYLTATKFNCDCDSNVLLFFQPVSSVSSKSFFVSRYKSCWYKRLLTRSDNTEVADSKSVMNINAYLCQGTPRKKVELINTTQRETTLTKCREGGPNIGNTCALIWIISTLYSVSGKKVRKDSLFLQQIPIKESQTTLFFLSLLLCFIISNKTNLKSNTCLIFTSFWIRKVKK